MVVWILLLCVDICLIHVDLKELQTIAKQYIKAYKLHISKPTKSQRISKDLNFDAQINKLGLYVNSFFLFKINKCPWNLGAPQMNASAFDLWLTSTKIAQTQRVAVEFTLTQAPICLKCLAKRTQIFIECTSLIPLQSYELPLSKQPN